MRYFSSVLLTILIAAALPSAALAAYVYTFSVPVTLSKLPPNSEISAACSFYKDATGGALPGAVPGRSTPPFPKPKADGSYSGTLSVPMRSETPPGAYACFVLIRDSGGILNFTGDPAQPGGANPQAGWTGTMSTGIVSPVPPGS